jgi:hypothetical protein
MIDQNRRAFLQGSLATAAAITSPAWVHAQETPAPTAAASAGRGILSAAHVPAKAKRVIFLQMCGGVSHIDTFDYKPLLREMHGQEMPPSVRGTQRLSTMVAGQTSFPVVQPIREFRQRGESGAWVSDLLPYTAAIADDLCFVKSMQATQVNHEPASKFLHTGFQLGGRPSAGAWVSYALGSDNDSLPAFIALVSKGTVSGQSVDSAVWGSGFLPSHYEGVQFRAGADPVLYVNNPKGVTAADRRRALDVIRRLADQQYAASGDSEIQSRVAQYEMAYRMQGSVPGVANVAEEPEYILDMYGPDVRTPGTFARNCLLARRLAERGVKFINLCQVGWDSHVAINTLHPLDCGMTDQPSAALIADLKQRGLLEDTLVVWATEFGRTPFAQGALDRNVGRDHNSSFTVWLAGAGVRKGVSYGVTDEFGYNIVENPVTIHDLHATMLHLLGIDHERLTYKYVGRDYRLTDVAGQVVHSILS